MRPKRPCFTPDEFARFASEVAAAARERWPDLPQRVFVTGFTFDGRTHSEIELRATRGDSRLTARWEVSKFWADPTYRRSIVHATLRSLRKDWPP